MTRSLAHERLVANAGSGKTYRLTVRTITLLALGVEPEKIATLTFTRKAAGEFLASVFRRLADAASDAAELARLLEDTEVSSLTQAQCLALLQKLAAQMHRLSMGTIDSLFGRIARSFPLETGLAGEFSILGETSRRSVCRDTLATVFREQSANEEMFVEFLDLVRQQSRAESELSVFSTLLKATNALHEKFLSTPSGTVWGDEKIIWPGGCAILKASDPASAADTLWQAIVSTHPDLAANALESWEVMLQSVRESDPKGIADFVGKKISTDRKTERDYIPTGKEHAARVYLNDAVKSAREQVLLALFKPQLEELLRRSRALHRVLENFESSYNRLVRMQGKLTFSDVTDLLASRVDSPEWRAQVGYRLDTQFDHWLLDEFQDTSRVQWKVLHGLVDDVIQDTGGDRSFFYVGDAKQAIYGWRGGDPRLFFEIADFYNRSGEIRIADANPLNVSHRSDPEILEVVNRVFGNMSFRNEDLGLPDKAIDEWQQAWVTHEVAPANAVNQGYVRWLPVDKKGTGEENTIDLAVAEILLEVRPWERGWTCAALKRSNDGVESLAALLQSLGIPVAVEGRANPCVDNPLGVALLAAFKLAASPDDQLSRILLAASPGVDFWVSADELAFRKKTLAFIAADGFAATAQSWVNAMELDSEFFLKARAAEFIDAAAQFDAMRQSGDDIGSFIGHMESYQREEPEGSGVVRVMTVHKAKGLTLDMTILSGMDRAFCENGAAGELALDQNVRGETWGLLMPVIKIAEMDPVLKTTCENLKAQDAYEGLCTAYVAMTRPRHGLYLVTARQKEDSSAKNLPRLLGLGLGHTETVFQFGNPQWFERKPLRESTATPMEIFLPLPKPVWNTPRPTGPSSLSAESNATPFRFSPGAAQRGTAIHALLAEIEWLPAQIPMELDSFFKTDVAQTLFRKPETPSLLWRERAFECEIEGKWVAGIFDRALIHLEANGTPLSAEVVDFKTEKSDSQSLQTKHAGQISSYRRAAAVLLGLDAAKVTARVISVG